MLLGGSNDRAASRARALLCLAACASLGHGLVAGRPRSGNPEQAHRSRATRAWQPAPRRASPSSGGDERREVLLVVAGALVDDRGRVLMATRDSGDDRGWEFPGGKVDADDASPEAALRRELREELGVECVLEAMAPLTFASRSLGRRHLLMPLFECDDWAGTPTPREGQRRIRFFSAAELDDLDAADVVDADVPMIPVVAARLRRREEAR